MFTLSYIKEGILIRETPSSRQELNDGTVLFFVLIVALPFFLKLHLTSCIFAILLLIRIQMNLRLYFANACYLSRKHCKHRLKLSCKVMHSYVICILVMRIVRTCQQKRQHSVNRAGSRVMQGKVDIYITCSIFTLFTWFYVLFNVHDVISAARSFS